jgi:hypothetical protein
MTITASLEAGLWVSDYACEGDLFCELIELCPRLKGSLTLHAAAHFANAQTRSCHNTFLRGRMSRKNSRRTAR